MELDKIIKILIRNSMITTFELTQLGYIDEDITEIINDGYIKRQGKGIYVIGNKETLISYAKSIEKRDPNFSKEIIDYCTHDKNQNLTPFYEKFDKAIQENNEIEAINYFKIIYKSLSKEKKSDGNYYLLLLSYLYDLPDEYKTKLKELKLEDVQLKEDNESAIVENQSRKNMFYKSYYDSKVGFEKRVSIDGKLSLEDKIEKDLIHAIVEKYRKHKKVIIDLIEEGKYKKLLQFLGKEEAKNFLNLKEEYLMKTVIDYIAIEEARMVPKVKVKSFSTFEAIKNKDYRMALQFMEDYRERKNINYQDTLYLMLVKINALYDRMKVPKKFISANVEETKENVKVVKPEREISIELPPDALPKYEKDLAYIEDIIALVKKEKFSFEGCLSELKLSEDEKNYARLLYARDCYYLKEYVIGDRYLKKVEQSSNKSREVKRLLAEIRIDKRYYSHRLAEDREKQLVFKK